MPLFLISYLLVYGGAHLYLLSRTVRAYSVLAPYRIIVAAVAIFMILAPVLVRILERYRWEGSARVVGYLGYLWMGFFFLYLSASIALDLIRGFAAAAAWIFSGVISFPDQRLLLVSFVMAAVASVYGLFFEARQLHVEKILIQSPKIPKEAGRVRIVQISDVHLGLMVGASGLKRILNRVTALRPDLLVSTGDLVDGQMDGLRGRDLELDRLRPPLGKYAVLGNHEVFAGVSPSVSFTESAGFQMLRGEAVAVTDFLTVAGVDDPALYRQRSGHPGDDAVLMPLPRDRFVLLLKHRPVLERASMGLFDLQLSGHVHKGQIFPFNLITHLAYPEPIGLSRKGDSYLYVSRGSGTWGPPIRFLAPPEVTVIDLVHGGE